MKLAPPASGVHNWQCISDACLSDLGHSWFIGQYHTHTKMTLCRTEQAVWKLFLVWKLLHRCGHCSRLSLDVSILIQPLSDEGKRTTYCAEDIEEP